MPIYEFYCADCHRIYNFFSRRIDTDTIPACPNSRCGRPALARQVSLFAVSKGRTEPEQNEPLGDIDEARLEKAMASLAGEMEGIDEDDPKQAAQAMRKLFDATGMQLSGNMAEALRRMETGEDPDRIEEDMGDLLENEDPFAARPKTVLNDLRRKYLPPEVDDTLYDL